MTTHKLLSTKTLLSVAAIALLGACADMSSGFSVGGDRKAALNDSAAVDPFQEALAVGYEAQGKEDYDEGNYRSADRFYLKASAAAAGIPVEMENPTFWTNATGDRAEGLNGADLQKAVDMRARLLPWIAQRRQTEPQNAAAQQVNYDCWIEEMAEQQYEHAALCKPVMQMAAAPAPVAGQPVVRSYIVFFDWNKSNLSDSAMAIIRTAAENFRKGGISRVEFTGHADRSGSDTYNMGISQRRAQSVSQAFSSLGVPSSAVSVNWKGERDALVATDDGVREPQNRRVEIVYP